MPFNGNILQENFFTQNIQEIADLEQFRASQRFLSYFFLISPSDIFKLILENY